MAKVFKVSFELIIEDRDFTAGDVEAELEKFEYSNPIEIRNVKIEKDTIG